MVFLLAPFALPFMPRRLSLPHDHLIMWLLRWLLFRLMFASGVVKLTSRCPSWWGLTGMCFVLLTSDFRADVVC